MSAAVLDQLRERHPEWAHWLAVVGCVVEELDRRGWEESVPGGPGWRADGTPLLADARLAFPRQQASRLFGALAATAGVRVPADDGHSSSAVLRAALNHEREPLDEFALAASVDAEHFRAVAALLPAPFLHACNRRWGIAAPENWVHGYCVICGAWPSFAEECGVDCIRYLRCGRCGAAWQTLRLMCAYCGTNDHESLATLVAEEEHSAIDVCRGCRGYTKVFTRLRPVPSRDVLLQDLASVTLDLAATARGYRRPAGTGYRLRTRLAGAGDDERGRH